MSPEPNEKDVELQRLHSEADALEHDIRDMGAHEHRQDTLIARLRREAAVRDDELSELRLRLEAAEHELEDLRAIRDALTPPELPQRARLGAGRGLRAPAAEQVSGDFYLVAEGPQDSTVLVVGDVVGHGLQAARRAAFVRTAFAATAPFSDDPCRLLSWANTALVERAGTTSEFVTAGLRDVPPGRAAPALGLRRPSARAACARRGRARRADPGPPARSPLRSRTTPRVRCEPRDRRGRAALHRRADRGAARRAFFGLEGVTVRAARARSPHRPRRSPSCARASPTSPTAP